MLTDFEKLMDIESLSYARVRLPEPPSAVTPHDIESVVAQGDRADYQAAPIEPEIVVDQSHEEHGKEVAVLSPGYRCRPTK